MGGMGGPYGPMGPGMMADGMAGGPGWGLGRLDLSGEQRKQLAEIQADIGRRQWALMNAMHAQGGPMHGSPWDEAEDRRSYEAMAAVHRQMFELQLEARRRMLAVLTPPQREQLERAGRGR
jgi:Spy/CpxP family protein refolding chaperone